MATPHEIGYKVKQDDGTFVEGRVTYNMPDSVDEAVQMWGDSVVLQKAIASVTIQLQNMCRDAENPEEAQKISNSFVPGVTRGRSGGPSKKSLIELLKSLSPDDLAALMAKAKGA